MTEKQLLHYYIDHPSSELEAIEFLSDIAKELKKVLLKLFSNDLEPFKEHILKYSTPPIDNDIVSVILDTTYQKDKLDFYKEELHRFKINRDVKDSILRDVTKELSKKEDVQVSILQSLHGKLGSAIDQLTSTETASEYLTFKDLVVEHKKVIEDRSKKVHQTTGCSFFDTLMPNIFPGISIIAGYSGSAKSTLLHYLQRQRLIKRLPTIAVNTELAKSSYMDAMLSPIMNVNYTDLMGVEFGDEPIDYTHIMDKMNQTENRFTNKKKFLYYDNYACSISDLEQFIIHARQSMNLSSQTILFAYVDLLSMLSDFNKSMGGNNKAEIINTGVDRLNEICLSHNVHLVGTVQIKRYAETKEITREEDIEKFRPSMADIKSSGSWEERARSVYLIHNPWNIVHKNPCNEIIKEMTDPVIDLTLTKSTYYGEGIGKKIKYLFRSSYKTFVPFIEEEDQMSVEN